LTWGTELKVYYHFLDLSLETQNSSLSEIISFIVFMVPSGLPLRILSCT